MRPGEFSGFGIRHSFVIWPSSFVILCIPFLAASAGAATSPYLIRWNTNSTLAIVEAAGVGEQTLRQVEAANWQPEDWQKLFSVYSGSGDAITDQNVPAMLGTYRVADGLIRFQPSFPLEPGVTYRAVF